MKMKPATQVTCKSTGPAAPTAMNTAPKVKPERGIGGFGRLKPAASTGPTQKVTARGYNPPSDAPKRSPKSMSGGSSQPGPTARGGTSSPKHGPGPGGLGLAGSKFPPIG